MDGLPAQSTRPVSPERHQQALLGMLTIAKVMHISDSRPGLAVVIDVLDCGLIDKLIVMRHSKDLCLSLPEQLDNAQENIRTQLMQNQFTAQEIEDIKV